MKTAQDQGVFINVVLTALCLQNTKEFANRSLTKNIPTYGPKSTFTKPYKRVFRVYKIISLF